MSMFKSLITVAANILGIEAATTPVVNRSSYWYRHPAGPGRKPSGAAAARRAAKRRRRAK